MIISHQYKYLFIEIPHTASTAIGRELCQMYAGRRILHKHAHYGEFQHQATEAEKGYFTFAGIRNPLDEAVSAYFKLKTNHKHRYTTPGRLLKHGGSVTRDNIRRFYFIQETGADFAPYFKEFYKFPYSNIIGLSARHCHFVMRFEQLQKDFAAALEAIGLKLKRPLPRLNETGGRDHDYLFYYSPEIIGRAKGVFGPFMKRWGYDFPAEWGATPDSWLKQLEFHLLDLLRCFIWQHVRWSPHFYGRWFRRIR